MDRANTDNERDRLPLVRLKVGCACYVWSSPTGHCVCALFVGKGLLCIMSIVHIHVHTHSLVNPLGACAERVTVVVLCVCVFVCLSVTTLAAARCNSTVKVRYDLAIL